LRRQATLPSLLARFAPGPPLLTGYPPYRPHTRPDQRRSLLETRRLSRQLRRGVHQLVPAQSLPQTTLDVVVAFQKQTYQNSTDRLLDTLLHPQSRPALPKIGLSLGPVPQHQIRAFLFIDCYSVASYDGRIRPTSYSASH